MPKIQLQLKLPLLLHHPNSLHPLLLHPRFAVRYCIRIQPSATVSATESATSAVRYCVDSDTLKRMRVQDRTLRVKFLHAA